jgi:hypothetical protein
MSQILGDCPRNGEMKKILIFTLTGINAIPRVDNQVEESAQRLELPCLPRLRFCKVASFDTNALYPPLLTFRSS